MEYDIVYFDGNLPKILQNGDKRDMRAVITEKAKDGWVVDQTVSWSRPPNSDSLQPPFYCMIIFRKERSKVGVA